MGIEWFRDLIIIIMGFVSTAVLVFIAVLVYRLYHTTKSTMLQVKEASKITFDTVTMLQNSIKPLLPILAIFQGIREGFEDICNVFKKKENNKGEN